MGKLFTVAVILALHCQLYAQSVDKQVRIKDLAAPTSPAFILTDVSPSAVQTPTTPKAFVLGLVKSFDESSGGFPQNYSAEFSPYWLIAPQNRSVYDLLGMTVPAGASEGRENPFAGLKFTTVSVAFLNKDLIGDAMESQHKVVSIGARSTILKFHQKDYEKNIIEKVNKWHDLSLAELAAVQDRMTRSSPEEVTVLLNEFANFKPKTTAAVLEEISELLAQKPLFSWDLAGAYAAYGVQDSTWSSGRGGIWTTASTYLPLKRGSNASSKNYFNLNVLGRYMVDNYYGDEDGTFAKRNNIDVGLKVALEFNNFSVGYEIIKRYVDGEGKPIEREVGIINYKITDSIYLNGAFGRNFEHPNKLIALFGVNFGIGSETMKIPE